MIRYYIFKDLINFDDDDDEQVSVYRTWIESEKQLTPQQVIDLAEEKADWKIDFGQGDFEKVDTYVIKGKDLQSNSYVLEWEGKV
tara:strand:+ start:2278 stop:2532 length:255 start_codon:yes stop_codon:yes gene_type:complete